MAIEYDGEQHFRSIDIFGGDEGFEKVKAGGKIKNELMLKNKDKINFFIRFSYKDLLTEEFVRNKIFMEMRHYALEQI